MGIIAWISGLSLSTAATIAGCLAGVTLVVIAFACLLEKWHLERLQAEERISTKEKAAQTWASALGASRAATILSMPYDMLSSTSFFSNQQQDHELESDEPLAGLNEAYKRRLKNLLRKLNPKKDVTMEEELLFTLEDGNGGIMMSSLPLTAKHDATFYLPNPPSAQGDLIPAATETADGTHQNKLFTTQRKYRITNDAPRAGDQVVSP